MQTEDFSVWLSGITRLSERQRREAVAALLTLEGSGREAGPQAKAKARFGAKHSRRPDALGASGHERVEARGCGALARTGAVPLQDLRAHVQRPHQNANGASAQEGTLADHALAMIEGKSLAKTAELCGVHPTTAFRWRHRFLGRARRPQAADAERNRRSGRDFSSSNPSRAGGPICRARRANAAERPDIRASPRATSPISSSATGKARLSTRSCLRSTASVEAALAGVVTPGNHLIGDGGEAIAAFARKARIPFHAVPSPTAEAPCDSLLMQPWQSPRPGVQAASEVRIWLTNNAAKRTLRRERGAQRPLSCARSSGPQSST